MSTQDFIEKSSFEYRGTKSFFRHIQEVGVSEYRHEDWNGIVILSIINPTINFHSFVEERVKVIMDRSA